MIKEDLKKLKELKWEVWNVRDEIKDKDIKNKLGKLLYEMINMIEERERELIFKMIEEYEELGQGMMNEEEKIDKRGLKVIRRKLGKNVIGEVRKKS